MLGLSDEKHIGLLLALGETLELADEHLEEAFEPRILDGEQVVDPRHRPGCQVGCGEALHRVHRDIDMANLAGSVSREPSGGVWRYIRHRTNRRATMAANSIA